MLRMSNDLDDASRISDVVAVPSDLLGTDQDLIANPSDFAWPAPARHLDADLWGSPMCILVPFLWRGEQFTVCITPADIGHDDGGQGAGMMEFFATALDKAFVGEFAQDLFERGAIVVL